MKISLIVSLCYIHPVLAYRNVGLEWLNDNPMKYADVVVVGKMSEDRSGEQFIIPERGWTKYPAQIHIPVNYNLDHAWKGKTKRGVAGRRYLLYMMKTGADKNKYVGIFVIELIQKAKPTINKFSNKKDFIGEINPSWQFCESDNECVNSKNQCGKHIGVNKKYKKDYLDFLKSKSMKTDCSKEKSSDAEKFSNSKCVENFCS